MKVIIQGILRNPSNLEITKYLKSLCLELYSCTLSKEQKVENISFEKKGNFKFELEQGDKAVQYIVKLVYKTSKKKEVLSTSAKLCAGKTHELDFYFDPKTNLNQFDFFNKVA